MKKLKLFFESTLSNLQNPKIIVLGENALNFLIRNNIQFYKYNKVCDFNTLNYLYEISSFYVGSIGYSMWERCAKKLPSFLIPIAHNQKEYLKVAEKLGVGLEINSSLPGSKNFLKN